MNWILDLAFFAAGALACGVVAHRRPEWFNRAVVIVNAIDDKVKSVKK
jgi:hypothetical protein